MSKKKPHLADLLFDGSSDDDMSPDLLAMETRLAALHGDAAETPSPDLWDRIETRIDRDASAPGTETIPLEEGVWEILTEGIERKVVQIDSAAGLQSYFIRMRSGAVFPIHQHDADEHCVILDGELEIGGHVHGPGTFHLARSGQPHVPITARSDALFFIRGAI